MKVLSNRKSFIALSFPCAFTFSFRSAISRMALASLLEPKDSRRYPLRDNVTLLSSTNFSYQKSIFYEPSIKPRVLLRIVSCSLLVKIEAFSLDNCLSEGDLFYHDNQAFDHLMWASCHDILKYLQYNSIIIEFNMPMQ